MTKPFTAVGSELLFEVFSQRYERGATLVTSNLPFDEWTSIFGSERLTGDRSRAKPKHQNTKRRRPHHQNMNRQGSTKLTWAS